MCLSDQEYCRAWKWGLWPQCIHLHPSIISLYALDSVHTLPPSSAPPGPRDHIHIQTPNWQGTVGLQGAHSRWVLLPEPLLDVQKEMGPRGCKGGIVKMRFTHSHNPQWHTCFVLRLYVGSSIRVLLSVLWQLVDSVDCFLSHLIQVSCQKNAETIVAASLTQIWVSSSLSWAQSAQMSSGKSHAEAPLYSVCCLFKISWFHNGSFFNYFCVL